MNTPIKHRKFQGLVVSDKMTKTVVVRVDRVKSHPKYGKQYRVSRKFMAHDPKSEYHIGDRVWIVASRPLSAKKRWRVMGKV